MIVTCMETLSSSITEKIMSGHEQSASTDDSASILLPRPGGAAKPDASVRRTFTKVNITRMHCPAGQGEVFFWDASCRGFGIRALRSGRRSWIYQYRDEHRRTRRIVLGDVSAVRLDAARDAARKHAAGVAQGANPSVDRKNKGNALSVLALVDAYLQHAKKSQRPRPYMETERHLRRHASPLHHDRAEALHRRDISDLLERVARKSGPICANRVRGTLSAMWTWALRSGFIEADSNPVAFTVRQPEKPRERTLLDAEVRAIWRATEDGSDYSRIVRLCILTGCRRDEIGRLRRDEIKADSIVIGAERMKSGIAHEIPLFPVMAELLAEIADGDRRQFIFGRFDTGFSGWSRCKKGLDARLVETIAMPPWTLHDLRRTFSTRLHDAGVEPIVIEALLAHKQQGVAAVYNRASFRMAKKAALEKWHDLLRGILGHTLGVSTTTNDL
jgi:integrase